MIIVLETIFDLIWMTAASLAFVRFVVIPLLIAMDGNRRESERAVFWSKYQNIMK